MIPNPSRTSPAGGALCLIGGVAMALGALLPFGRSSCSTCRVIAPRGVSLVVWLPSAAEPLLMVALAIGIGLWMLMGRPTGRFLSGFTTALGIFGVGRFLAYGVHVRFPSGGLFGLGGLVAMGGGLLVVASGILSLKSN
jgi:hypothetical protein